MKNSVINTVLFVLSVLCSEASAGQYKDIDIESVDYVEIAVNEKKDRQVHLTEEQGREFIERWNGASPRGLCKFYAKYVITVHGKDGETRTFRATGDTVKEDKDYCFVLDDRWPESVWKKKSEALYDR